MKNHHQPLNTISGGGGGFVVVVVESQWVSDLGGEERVDGGGRGDERVDNGQRLVMKMIMVDRRGDESRKKLRLSKEQRMSLCLGL
ncbi:hypothetical protein Tco_0878715 [Tanacetum coccineum]|uniref:Uncharacterized protein n=1 Tax=Tanacetum coccineum TaxID=301880 RepID=A0ABQ5C413_9ASTR